MSDSSNHALKRTAPDDNAGNASKKAKPDVAKIMAEARARAAQTAARLAAAKGQPVPSPTAASVSPTPAPGAAGAPPLSAAQQRLAETNAGLTSTLSRSAAATRAVSGGVTRSSLAHAPVPARPPPVE